MQQQLLVGTLLRGGTYRIEAVLGQGTFGITYLAEHTGLDRKVAIKEFFMKELNSRGESGSITGMSDGSLSYNYCQKFQKEAINLSRLDHPNIVRVTDSFCENGTYYYVMDYIEGQNLNDYVNSHHILEQEAVDIIKSVADALIYMHEEKHMLHLDLKPGNVMRRASDGHIFLIDFGLSKHYGDDGNPETSTTIGFGTAGYAPIEQSNTTKNGEFRPTIDVYALGATFFKLLTRMTPPPASDIVSDDVVLENNLREKNVSDNLIKVITEAMCPNVRRRTQTIRDFKNDILDGATATQMTAVKEIKCTLKTENTEETILSAKAQSNVEYEPIQQKKYSIFSFKGRVGRFGAVLIVILIFSWVRFLFYNPDAKLLYWLPILFIFYLYLTLSAKRCHDLNHTGWFQLIPFYILVMLFAAGDDEKNDYGEKDNGVSFISFAKGIIAFYVIAFICGLAEAILEDVCPNLWTVLFGKGSFWWLLVVAVTNSPKYSFNRCKSATCKFLSRDQKSARDKNGTKPRKNKVKNTSLEISLVEYLCFVCKGTNLSLEKRGEIPISLIHNSFSYHCTPNVVIANGFDLKRLGLRKLGVKFCFALCWTFSKTRTGNRTKDLPPLLSNPWFGECLNDRHLKMLNFK